MSLSPASYWSVLRTSKMRSQVLFVLFVGLVSTLGAPSTSEDSKVIGGENAAPGEFPWMVSLRRSGSHFCGGSIISKDVILTAAHCVVRTSPSSVTVVSGSTTLNSGGNSHRVSKITTHESYDENDSARNDVAILKLASPIVFSSVEQPVPLPSQGENPGDNADSVASGWGYTRYPSGSLPNNLQKVSLQLTTNDNCNSMQSDPIYSTHICAGLVNGEGVCNGDSGGPLVSGGKQVGIVSWGEPCAVGIPDVYTRVASFADWIAQKSK